MRTSIFSFLIICTMWIGDCAFAVTEKKIDTFVASGDQCLTHHLDRYIWVRGKDSEWRGQSFKNRYSTALKLYKQQSQNGGFKTLLNGPWDRALAPVFEAQRDAIFDALLMVDTTGSLLQGATYDSSGNLLSLDALELYLEQNRYRNLPTMIKAVGASFGAKQRKLEELISPPPDEAFSDRLKKVTLISGACTQLSVTQALSCTSAVKQLLAETNFNSNIVFPKIWNEFIRTQQLREGVRQTALLMLSRIKNKTPGTFLDDLIQGFRRAGFPAGKADMAAWKFLALYGNGGANTGSRILGFDLPNETEVLGVSMSFIGTAVSYLDFSQRMAGGGHYALPKEVAGSCLTPKPYHFWLNAYMSHWLVSQGYSPAVAQSAAFILNKGYQVNRDVNNAGGGIEKLLSKPTNHPTNEVIRLDLSMGAAGDVYGSLVDHQKIKPVLIGEGLQLLRSVRSSTEPLSQSSVFEQLTSDRVRFIKMWDDLYQPNQVLQFFQAHQN